MINDVINEEMKQFQDNVNEYVDQIPKGVA